MSKSGVTGVILAGGMSRRLGRNKALELVGGQRLIERVIERVGSVVDRVLVVVNDDQRARELKLPGHVETAVDEYPDTGSLGGIYTGLAAGSTPWILVVGCDMPFLNKNLMRHLLNNRHDADVVVPMLDGRPEPTHAAYSKVCLPHIQRKIQSNRLKISGFFDDVTVNSIPQDEVERLDPERLSFFNVNTQDDLDKALRLANEH
jgi:molybdopterin-guanine dinucleotide biosynthesis protein A